jgi:hypothetical protein
MIISRPVAKRHQPVSQRESGGHYMKARISSGATLAIAAVSLAVAGMSPAQARHKAPRAHKAQVEKHACGGKNGCPAASDEKTMPATPQAATPAAPPAAPPAPKPAESK